MGADGAAQINNDKCISCGACVYMCPFGAVNDKSYIVQAVKLLKGSLNNTKYHVYALVAPALQSQFTYVRPGQLTGGLRALGFYRTMETALGADMVAMDEARELVEKEFLTSSCCPAFVSYIHKNFPKLVEHISHNPSPMAKIAKEIKKSDPLAKIIFIGPCTAKKAEIKLEHVRDVVDCVLTFEELQALFDSRDIDLTTMEPEPIQEATYYGRIFARSGGLAAAVSEALKELGEEDFQLEALSCSGIDECRIALLKANRGVLPNNFIEGMACVNGCIGGAGCLTPGAVNKNVVDN